MRSRELRFKGRGNFAVGDGPRHPAWRVKCSSCDSQKVIIMAGGFMQPETVIKKLTNAGWYIGKHGGEDFCGDCLRKRKERHEKEAIAALNQPTPVNEKITESAALEREKKFIAYIHGLLVNGLSNEAIQRIEAHLPTWPLQRARPAIIAPPPRAKAEPVDDFDQWLVQQQQQHKAYGKKDDDLL